MPCRRGMVSGVFLGAHPTLASERTIVTVAGLVIVLKSKDRETRRQVVLLYRESISTRIRGSQDHRDGERKVSPRFKAKRMSYVSY